MSFEPIWGSIIAWYLFLAGLGGGAFITSGYLRFRHPEAVHMRKIGHIIAPIVVMIGLVLLMFDAHAGFNSPLRFALLLTNFGSVMTWGVVFLAVFMVVSLIVLLFDVLKREVPVVLEVIGMGCGVCVGMYTGALLGVCQTFPLWNNALLPILFLVSALSTGAAAVLCFGAALYPDEFNHIDSLKKAHYCLPLIEILMVFCLLFVTSSNSEAGFNSVMSLLGGNYAWLFWIGFFLIGLAGPSLIETWMLFFTKRSFENSRTANWISFGSDAGVLIGGFLLRYLIIVASLPLTMVVPML